MKRIIAFYIIVSTLTLQLCFAQSEAGHGGNAVVINEGTPNEKYYLLDLFEAKIHETGGVDESLHDCPYQASSMNGVHGSCLWYSMYSNLDFASFGREVMRGVLNAATHLPDYEGLALMKAIELFDWNFLPIPLRDLRDANTPLDLKDYPIYQLAVRKDHTITINSLIWDKLDLLNKVALITHEALYAMVRPIADLAHPGFSFQDSYYARQFNAKLYRVYLNPDGTPQGYFRPRLRQEMIDDEYTFTPYTVAFGNYGEADDFIGRNVLSNGRLVNKSYLSTGAYIKLEGAVQTNLVPGAPPETVAREQLTFFKRGAEDVCRQVFANIGKYKLKVSLVRTLFTMDLASYPSFSGHSRYIRVVPTEMTFSKWYHGQLGSIQDEFEILTLDETSCIQQLKSAATQFETIMKSAPDSRDFWF